MKFKLFGHFSCLWFLWFVLFGEFFCICGVTVVVIKNRDQWWKLSYMHKKLQKLAKYYYIFHWFKLFCTFSFWFFPNCLCVGNTASFGWWKLISKSKSFKNCFTSVTLIGMWENVCVSWVPKKHLLHNNYNLV